jgi:hypothetical protein
VVKTLELAVAVEEMFKALPQPVLAALVIQAS